MSWPPSKDELQKMIDKIANTGMKVEPRIVSPKQYDVIKSIVDDGLISGMPYSEFSAFDEYVKRMNTAESPVPTGDEKV